MSPALSIISKVIISKVIISKVIISIVVVSIFIFRGASYHYTECHYAECHYTECRLAVLSFTHARAFPGATTFGIMTLSIMGLFASLSIIDT
jgi:hypothetical protein